jgi:hypothetical protein
LKQLLSNPQLVAEASIKEATMGKLLERYRPELHYMRGPKWLEKHGLNLRHGADSHSELAKAKGWREAVLNRLKSLSAEYEQAR